MNTHYQHHVFFCLNKREDGSNCCTDHHAEAAFDHMKAQVKKLNLNGKGKVRINRAGCLDRCGEGPVLVVYPFGIPLLIKQILMKLLQNICKAEKSFRACKLYKPN